MFLDLRCSSFCTYHRPTQQIHLRESDGKNCPICLNDIEWNSCPFLADVPLLTPCCKVWFHNKCLQVMNFLDDLILSMIASEFLAFMVESNLSDLAINGSVEEHDQTSNLWDIYESFFSHSLQPKVKELI